MMKAAEQGHVRSMLALGDFYRLGRHGVPKDVAQAVAWYQKAADFGDSQTGERVAIAYYYGLGVPKDIAQGRLWYRKAEEQDRKDAQAGDVSAQLALALKYETGFGASLGLGTIAVDKSTALYWYEKAAEQDGPLKAAAEAGVARLKGHVAPEAKPQ